MTSILVSRFILNLRDAASGTEHAASLFPLDKSWRLADTSMPSFLEPLGALLDHSEHTVTDSDEVSVGRQNPGDLYEVEDHIEMPRVGIKDV